MSITERLITKDLCVPFEEGSEHREELVQTIIDANIQVLKCESEISVIKARMKPFVEEMDTAIADLTQGAPQLVKCKETIFWDDNRVEAVRLDTLEKLPDREINEQDRQSRTDDVDVK